MFSPSQQMASASQVNAKGRRKRAKPGRPSIGSVTAKDDETMSPSTPVSRFATRHHDAFSPFSFRSSQESPRPDPPASPSVILFSGPAQRGFERVHDDTFPQNVQLLKDMARTKFKLPVSAPVEMSYVNPDGVVCELDDEHDLRALAMHAALSQKVKVNVASSADTNAEMPPPGPTTNGASAAGSTTPLPNLKPKESQATPKRPSTIPSTNGASVDPTQINAPNKTVADISTKSATPQANGRTRKRAEPIKSQQKSPSKSAPTEVAPATPAGRDANGVNRWEDREDPAALVARLFPSVAPEGSSNAQDDAVATSASHTQAEAPPPASSGVAPTHVTKKASAKRKRVDNSPPPPPSSSFVPETPSSPIGPIAKKPRGRSKKSLANDAASTAADAAASAPPTEGSAPVETAPPATQTSIASLPAANGVADQMQAPTETPKRKAGRPKKSVAASPARTAPSQPEFPAAAEAESSLNSNATTGSTQPDASPVPSQTESAAATPSQGPRLTANGKRIGRPPKKATAAAQIAAPKEKHSQAVSEVAETVPTSTAKKTTRATKASKARASAAAAEPVASSQMAAAAASGAAPDAEVPVDQVTEEAPSTQASEVAPPATQEHPDVAPPASGKRAAAIPRGSKAVAAKAANAAAAAATEDQVMEDATATQEREAVPRSSAPSIPVATQEEEVAAPPASGKRAAAKPRATKAAAAKAAKTAEAAIAAEDQVMEDVVATSDPAATVASQEDHDVTPPASGKSAAKPRVTKAAAAKAAKAAAAAAAAAAASSAEDQATQGATSTQPDEAVPKTPAAAAPEAAQEGDAAPAASGKPAAKPRASRAITKAAADTDKCIVCGETPNHEKENCSVWLGGSQAILDLLSMIRNKSRKSKQEKESTKVLHQWLSQQFGVPQHDLTASQDSVTTLKDSAFAASEDAPQTAGAAPVSTQESAKEQGEGDAATAAAAQEKATRTKTAAEKRRAKKGEAAAAAASAEKESQLPPPSGVEAIPNTTTPAVPASPEKRSAAKTTRGAGKKDTTTAAAAKSAATLTASEPTIALTPSSPAHPSMSQSSATEEASRGLRAPSESSEAELATSPMLSAAPREGHDMDVEPLPVQSQPSSSSTAAQQLEERKRKMKMADRGARGSTSPATLKDLVAARGSRSRSASITSSDTSHGGQSSGNEDSDADSDADVSRRSKAASSKSTRSPARPTRRSVGAADKRAAPPSSSDSDSSSSSSGSETESEPEPEANTPNASTTTTPAGARSKPTPSSQSQPTARNPFLRGLTPLSTRTGANGKSTSFTRLSDLKPATLRQNLSQPGSPLSTGGSTPLSGSSQTPFFSQPVANGISAVEEKQGEIESDYESDSSASTSSSSSSSDDDGAVGVKRGKGRVTAKAVGKRAGVNAAAAKPAKKKKSVFGLFG